MKFKSLKIHPVTIISVLSFAFMAATSSASAWNYSQNMHMNNFNEVPRFRVPSRLQLVSLPHRQQLHTKTENNFNEKPRNRNNQIINQNLHILLRQHVSVGAQAFMARYDNRPELDQLSSQVNQNTQQLSILVGQLFGLDKQGDFTNLWNYHINSLNMYTDAVRQHDENQKQQALANLTDFTNKISNFFANASNNNAQNQLQMMFQMHIQDEVSIINAHAAGDQEQVQQLLQSGTIHADMMADQLYQLSQR